MPQWAIEFPGGDNISKEKVTLGDKIGPRDLLERGSTTSTELSILFSLGQNLLCLPFYIHIYIHTHIRVYVYMCGYSTHPKISVCWATDHCCTIKLGAPDSSCVTCERTQVLCKERNDSACEANSTLCILVINNKHGTCICPNMVFVSTSSTASHLSRDGVPHSECVVIWSTHNSATRELQTRYLRTWEDETLTVVDQILTE